MKKPLVFFRQWLYNIYKTQEVINYIYIYYKNNTINQIVTCAKIYLK